MKRILFFLLTLSTFSAYPEETRLDSLARVLNKHKQDDTLKAWLLNELSWEYSFDNSETSLEYAKKALDISEKLGYIEGIGSAYNVLGINYRALGEYQKAKEVLVKGMQVRIRQGAFNRVAAATVNLANVYLFNEEYPEAIALYKRALVICDSLNINGARSQATVNLAICYERIGDFKTALDYEFKALSLNRQTGDTIEEAFALQAIAITFQKQNQYQRALDFSRQSLNIFLKTKYTDAISACYNDLGTIYSKLGQPEKGLESYKKALDIAIAAERKDDISTFLHNIGTVYHELRNYDQALIYQKKALEVGIESQNDNATSKIYLSLFEIYKEKNDPETALTYANAALESAKKAGRSALYAECYEALAYCHSESGNYKEAFRLQELLTKIKDSTYTTETARQLAQVEIMYETDKKEKEIALLTKENQIRNEKLARQQVLNYSIGGGLLLITGLSLVTYKRYREKKKSNLELQEKNEAITNQKQEIEFQSSIIEAKNKDITDSINYAKRIQRSFLPASSIAEKVLPAHFILYKPKDIVSGDFYWIGNNKELGQNRFLLATGDCTGHGVPGAFMSIIGVSLLNEIVLKRKVYSPEHVLNELRAEIIKAVNPEGSTEEGKDGMDISLCHIDRDTMQLQFAGANNGIILVRNKELIELKPDKFPVGKSINEDKLFTLTTFNLQPGDRIYSYTDGFADQFGGPYGKKFKRKNLQELLISLPGNIAEQRNGLENALSEWMQGYEQVDDICVVGLEV